MQSSRCLHLFLLIFWSFFFLCRVEAQAFQDSFKNSIAADRPAIYWDFEASLERLAPKLVGSEAKLEPTQVGSSNFDSGAIAPKFPLMPECHQALILDGKSYIRFPDPGENSVFDFDVGDAITIEAWVSPTQMQGQYCYIIGKGRTYLVGQVKENHNWSLRLSKKGGGAALSFMFRSVGENNNYHRWESKQSLVVGDGWHHIAVSYVFGDPKSIRGYIDGQSTQGVWEVGGATTRGPMISNDEVWIGSAMGGNKGSTLLGGLDEIAIHRRVIPAERLKARYRYASSQLAKVEIPQNEVLVQIFNKGASNGWSFRRLKLTESFTQEVFAFPQLPKRYDNRGVNVDRPTQLLMQAHAKIHIPDGKHRLLFRSREISRLFVDGELQAETKPYAISQEANGPIWDLDRSHGPNIRPLQRGDRQAVVEIAGDGKEHEVRLEIQIGLGKRSGYMGEASLSIASEDGDFQLVSFGPKFSLTEKDWPKFLEWDRKRLQRLNRERQLLASVEEGKYWNWRHELARDQIAASGHDQAKQVDDFVVDNDLEPLPDLEFLRRVSLDIVGTIPDRELIEMYLDLPLNKRRSETINFLLQREGWADHWVGYWQDVLAENPNIVNPTLNNTGPFRWWIHESFLWNKPFDRFVTELIMMEGGKYEGGPAGFGVASANDVPMAAKGHLLGQAFLGVQMQCARCHDAPAHEIAQEDLFSIAAMLKRAPEDVPLTSSIDLPPEELEEMAVQVTLKPGSKVAPKWPFPELSSSELDSRVLRRKGDSREELAALITVPTNRRFAEVAVNRLWKRYLGVGLVNSVDDWELADRRNPELLEWLSSEFIASGYDVKHIARLILNSKIYQSTPATPDARKEETFIGPMQRKLAAEQLLDSLFVVSGKAYEAGQMTFDIDGARPRDLSLHLGIPRRAWMLTATSNERDRPGLAMPFAAPFVTFLEQFGWRGSRQNPVTQRPDDLTALQPAEFANGVLARRTTRLSDDHLLTELAVGKKLTLEQLIEELYLHALTRYPTERERQLVTDLLSAGFEQRRITEAKITERIRDRRGMVSWSNHLEEEASRIKLELEQQVRAGDLPTQRLVSDWRERLEDVLWSLTNSPEFRFSP